MHDDDHIHQPGEDLDNDGHVTEDEHTVFFMKFKSRRRLTIGAFVAILLVTAFLLIAPAAGVVSIALLQAYGVVLGFFYVGMFGIIATFFGVEKWLSKK